jgi:hypothetical protein
MGIIFKGGAAGGTQVGQVESGGIIYAYAGNRVGHIESDGIVFAYPGNRVGHVESDGIVYAYPGSCVGHVESGGIVFAGGAAGGTCVGHVEGGDELAGGAALLLGLFDVKSKSGNDNIERQSQGTEEKPGCLGMIFKFIAFCFRLFKTWGGRAGMLLGVIAGIAMASQTKDFMNALFIGIFAVLLLLFIGGALGTLVGFIFRKSSKVGKFGGLIGAGALALAGVILCLIERMRVNNIIMFACVGLTVGWILGTIIGNIVGLIKKADSKGKQSQ